MTTKPKRILIVDDDADIVANLSDILTDLGFRIDTALSGEAALEMVKECCGNGHCCYDVCLLDFKMPGMDGVELLQRFQKDNSKFRAIMITAYAGDDGVQRAVAAGTWEVLRKPVDIPALLKCIDAALA